MAKPSKANILHGDSTAALVKAFRRAVEDLPGELKVSSQKLKPGPFLNAVAAYFVSLSEEARIDLATRAVSELYAFDPEWGNDVKAAAEPKRPRSGINVKDAEAKTKPGRAKKGA